MIIGNCGNGKEKRLTVIRYDNTLVILPFSEVMDTEIKKWHITNTSKKSSKRQEETRRDRNVCVFHTFSIKNSDGGNVFV